MFVVRDGWMRRRGDGNINYSEDCYKCDRRRLNVRGGGRLQKFKSQRGFGEKLPDNWWRNSIIPSSASDEVRPRIDTDRAERLRRKHCDWKIEVGVVRCRMTPYQQPSRPARARPIPGARNVFTEVRVFHTLPLWPLLRQRGPHTRPANRVPFLSHTNIYNL